jgi:hypothetical protein
MGKRWFGRRSRARETACAIGCAALLAPTGAAFADDGRNTPPAAGNDAAAPTASADPLKTRFIINDADPESAVPSPQEAIKSPLQMGYWVMLVSDRAEAAQKRHDYAAAVKYYRAIAKAAPDRAVAFSKMCLAYEAAADWKSAVAACEISLQKEGVTIEDHQHFVRLMLSKPEPLTPAEVKETDGVIAHLQDELANMPTSGPDAPAAELQKARKFVLERLKCEVAARLSDRKRLEACVSAMRAQAPQEASTTAFAFALALVSHDYDEAERLIAGARSVGVKEEGIAFMRERLRVELEHRPFLARVFGNARGLGVALVALAVLAFATLFVRRKRLGLRTA